MPTVLRQAQVHPFYSGNSNRIYMMYIWIQCMIQELTQDLAGCFTWTPNFLEDVRKKSISPFEPSIFSHHLHIMLFPEKQHLFPRIHHMFPPQKKGGNLLPSSPPGLVDGRGQQPLSTIRGASGGSTGGDLKLKAWFQPEQHRHHRFYLFYLSYFYLPVMHIILYI